ncbi:oligopeptide/dipeptide ABC transporter, ATP-binding protein, C-terminal domain protein [Archaeoglobus sulfaticallidus PM70-1]|uniref:Oligopeptide/dipeptide ABC transporter, ATP-binding protein, C-terminal domain protein n=1 Tax=Archaeoglobus sulfaticallidus PM70-1 TaxID=387631 RepID=N0BBM8_9EURY|nr:ABC transporter ATP-binding protein [Archaeoglobus sulfaticallidus]AGK60413.1 oligopeptide/dipeptide ABC transporter, ATP-binding protein, C-terminal domain protein [Archaeoglobus sulfaticallidus PM70-1]
MQSTKYILQVRNLKKYFPVKGLFFTKGYVKAVDGVSFEILRGETFGLVGESGCGKTTVGRTILRLIEPTDGQILFEGKDIMKFSKKDINRFRRKAQIMFQDPYSSLNPRQTVFQIVMEPVRHHGIEVDDPEAFVIDLLERVGLNESHLYRYPHEFSGGQRQRIAMARILSLKPEFVVLDEPTSALDVSVQANILNTLKDIQDEYKLTYLFISHDLAIVKYMSHRIGVMYLGKLAEVGNSESIFEEPLHPYTKALFSAIPIPDPDIEKKKERIKVIGEPPSPINPPEGCRFNPRCQYAKDICREKEPELKKVDSDRFVACWLY